MGVEKVKIKIKNKKIIKIQISEVQDAINAVKTKMQQIGEDVENYAGIKIYLNKTFESIEEKKKENPAKFKGIEL